MSEHSIVVDMRSPSWFLFECAVPDGASCHAVWDCECETVWRYRVVDGKPAHDSTMEGTEEAGNDVHVGRFDNNQCILDDWFDNQEGCVSGEVRVGVVPVFGIDYVSFEAVEAGMVTPDE